MSIRIIFSKLFEKVPPLARLRCRLSNHISLHGNKFTFESIHISHNNINLRGSQNSIECMSNSFFRDSHLNVYGCDNLVLIHQQSYIYGDQRQCIHIDGNNNRIIIGCNCNIRGSTFFIRGSNNTIRVSDNCSICNTELHIEQDNNEIQIGTGCTTHGRDGHRIHIALDEGSKLSIGEDCMLSNSIQMRTTDSHSIIDKGHHRINPAKDIIIGQHCWIGLSCILLKGTQIADNSVVAAGSVCTKRYPNSNVVIAGNPAKIVKTEINWDRKFIPVE